MRTKVKTITMTQKSYPDVIDAVNKIAHYHERNPHDMIRILVDRELRNIIRKERGTR
jgi:hypothetical protein